MEWWCGGGEAVIFLLFVVFHFSFVLADVDSTTTTTSSTTAAASYVRDPREYCATQEFHPQCLEDQEVVVITEAGYGRMSIGECVKQDYGYLGCTAEVLAQMDEYCSGRRNCSVRIPDSRLEEVNTCPKEFKAYLNASYECVEVDKAPCFGCSPLTRSSLARITRSRGFIGSVVTLESTSGLCGSAQCPWYIEVQSGQTINLTLYDFSSRHASAGSSAPGGGQCTRLAVIKEATHVKETPVCYGRNRIQPVYSSVSQSIQIHVVSREVLKAKGHFLIQYEVIGCPDLQAPENARLKRMGDRMIVECRDASLRWESICVDSRWEGEIGTCPGSSLQTTTAPSFLTLPLGVLVAIVMGIALVIGVLIVTVGVVCIKRQQTDLFSRTGNVLYVPAGQCYELRGEDRPAGQSSGIPGRKTTTGRTSQQSYGGGSFKEPHLYPGRRNVYAHARMESRPLPSLPNFDEAVICVGGGGDPQGPGGRVVHAVELGPCPYHLHAITSSFSPGSSSTLGRTKGKKKSPGGKRREEDPRGSGGTPVHHRVIPVAAPCCGVGGIGPSFPAQHYTVLDPIEVQQQLTGTLRGEQGRSPTKQQQQQRGEPPSACQGPSAGAGGASRCGGEGGIEKSSCREITLRPTRQNSSRTKTDDANDVSNSGNSSWP